MRRLLNKFGPDPREIFKAHKSELVAITGIGNQIAKSVLSWETYVHLGREKDRLKEFGVDFLTQESPFYPNLLEELYDSPIGLYWKGTFKVERPCIGIVGTRQPSLYGVEVARKFASGLCESGFCVVSGLARGIDTAAHQGALSVGGPTIAVLGSGLDLIYPPENKALYDEICTKGAVITEFPFGRRVDRQTFPMRNRIISGLCQAIIVVETGVSGGSMITARFAGEQGRNLFAVPGRINTHEAQGCHQLIRDGATLITSVKEILEELNYACSPKLNEETQLKGEEVSVALSEDEHAILMLLKQGAEGIPDFIANRLGFPISRVSAVLTCLELKHLIKKGSDGTFEVS